MNSLDVDMVIALMSNCKTPKIPTRENRHHNPRIVRLTYLIHLLNLVCGTNLKESINIGNENKNIVVKKPSFIL